MVQSSKPVSEVIYMTPKGPQVMMFIGLETDNLCRTARQIGATHWICQDGFDHAQQMPIWALFELRKCNPDGGGPRRWSLAVPTKTWVMPNIDPLFMYAMHHEQARQARKDR
jgi:hypothetical protein